MSRTDYRKLCVELFGTDDVDRLRKIAELARKQNPRNAGRKRKFGAEEIARMRDLQVAGATIQQIANKFGTSRQIVSKYLHTPLAAPYTMRITYMYRQKPCTTIDVNFLEEKIQICNLTTDPLHRAFGSNEHPTWTDFQQFLQDRCIPASRGMLKEALNDIGVDTYDPLRIAEKTKGRTADDDLWLKFQYRTEGGAPA